MDTPIYACSFLGTKTAVYRDRIEQKKLFGLGRKSVPIRQVAGVSVVPMMAKAIIETTGGREHEFYLGNRTNLEEFERTINALLNV